MSKRLKGSKRPTSPVVDGKPDRADTRPTPLLTPETAAAVFARLEQATLALERATQSTRIARVQAGGAQAEDEMLRRNRELSVLNSIASTLSSTLDLEEMLRNVLDKLISLLGVDVGVIFLLDKEAGEVRVKVHRGASEALVRDADRIKLGTGAAGRVALTGEPIIIDNVAEDPRTVVMAAVQENLRAYACVPIQFRAEVLGALSLLSHKLRFFRPDELQLLVAIGHQIGAALENARLHDQVMLVQRERIRSLRQRLQSVMQAQVEERIRLSRSLREEVGFALDELAADLLVTAETDPNFAGPATTARNVHKSLQRLIRDLSASHTGERLEDLLERELLPRLRRETGCRTVLEYSAWPNDLPLEVEHHLEDVIRELLASLKGQPHVRQIKLRLGADESWLRLGVQASGGAAQVDGRLLSLASLRERVNLIGGELRLENAPRGELRAEAWLPRYRVADPTRSISVLLVCADPWVRGAIESTLETQSNVELVGIALTAQQATDLSQELKPDVTLVHLDLLNRSLSRAGQWLASLMPDLRVVILTPSAADARVPTALKAGALGCVLQDCTPEELRQAITTIYTGDCLLSPAVAREVFQNETAIAGTVSSPDADSQLTAREVEILRLVGAGRGTRQIAATLEISQKTVRNHLSHIYEKLQLNDRSQLVLYAHQRSLA